MCNNSTQYTTNELIFLTIQGLHQWRKNKDKRMIFILHLRAELTAATILVHLQSVKMIKQ